MGSLLFIRDFLWGFALAFLSIDATSQAKTDLYWSSGKETCAGETWKGLRDNGAVEERALSAEKTAEMSKRALGAEKIEKLGKQKEKQPETWLKKALGTEEMSRKQC